jgi:hypothetical protein
MKSDFGKQVYNSLKLKETQDLLSIWYENDHKQWSEEAFQAIELILISRLGKIPPKPEPEKANSDDSSGIVEDPEFYKPKKVLALSLLMNKVAVASIYVNILLPISFILAVYHFGKVSLNQIPAEYVFLLIIVAVIILPIQIVTTYFGLKALASILSILMEMELNSRTVK